MGIFLPSGHIKQLAGIRIPSFLTITDFFFFTVFLFHRIFLSLYGFLYSFHSKYWDIISVRYSAAYTKKAFPHSEKRLFPIGLGNDQDQAVCDNFQYFYPWHTVPLPSSEMDIPA